MNRKGLLFLTSCVFILGAGILGAQMINLPSGKQLIGEVPGHPQRLNACRSLWLFRLTIVTS